MGARTSNREALEIDTRRRFVAGLAALPTLGLLPGCATTSFTCPPNPADPGVVNWIPDVAHPVLWGVDTVGPADGAPRNAQIYYPSPALIGPRILGECLVRWPVAVFLHGDPPDGVPVSGYYKRWFRIPSAIARCGYVVVVPDQGFVGLPDTGPVAAVMDDIAWVRTGWRGAPWVDRRPTATAALGHSRGGLLASAVAGAHPEIAAMVSFSGTFLELPDPVSNLDAVKCPRLYMYNYDGEIAFDEDLDATARLWDRLDPSQPKYAVTYSGQHFDYLEPSDSGPATRGSCPEIPGVAADLAALFLSATIRSLTQVRNDLTLPSVTLTPNQQLLAEGNQQSMQQVHSDKSCHISLRWIHLGAGSTRMIGT